MQMEKIDIDIEKELDDINILLDQINECAELLEA